MKGLVAALMLLVLPCHASAPTPQLYFNAEVDETSVEATVAWLDRNPGPVVIVINSPGGSVFAGLELAHVIQTRGEVTCRVDGMAASMALYLLESCERREMTPSSFLLGHEASGAVRGQPDELERGFRFLKLLSHCLAVFITQRTHVSIADYEAATAHGGEYLLSASDALKAGFIDAISP